MTGTINKTPFSVYTEGKLLSMGCTRNQDNNLYNQITEISFKIGPELKKLPFLEEDPRLKSTSKEPGSTYSKRYKEKKEELEKEYIKHNQVYLKIQPGLTGITYCPFCDNKNNTISNELITLKDPGSKKEVQFLSLEFHFITEHPDFFVSKKEGKVSRSSSEYLSRSRKKTEILPLNEKQLLQLLERLKKAEEILNNRKQRTDQRWKSL